jgi:5-methylcytosine-specific restriction endonuclease McrA
VKFDSARALRKATGRAKSDVANKLVSMFLHEVSRRACIAGGLNLTDPRYSDSVIAAFGHSCLYCGQDLEHDRAAVEHLNGMNRFQVGLHVPGNVALSCRRCNNEKRRDDLNPTLSPRYWGWESFLLHDRSFCVSACKTCDYWERIFEDRGERAEHLRRTRERIIAFQRPYENFTVWADLARSTIREKVESLYRLCQSFASTEIARLTEEIDFDFSSLSSDSVSRGISLTDTKRSREQ